MPSDIFTLTKEIPDNEKSSIVIDSAIGVPAYLLQPGLSQDQRLIVHAKALIDTGCSKTSISQRLAKACKLVSFRKAKMENAGGVNIVNIYTVDIFLLKTLIKPNVDVSEFVTNNKFDIIIGMDIIADIDMAITNANRKMVFSLRMPPNPVGHIDYNYQKENSSKNKELVKNYNRLLKKAK